MGNPEGFHAEDGSGYEFLTDFIMDMDTKNPQMSARLVDMLGSYGQYKDTLADEMQDQLTRIAEMDKLSKDLGEKVRRFLGAATYDAIRQSKSAAPGVAGVNDECKSNR